jgi:hypothetical protein
MDNTQHEEGGGLLVGAARIKAYLIKTRGMPPTTDPYYLKKRGWPIGNLHGDTGSLIASPRKLDRHLDKLTAA